MNILLTGATGYLGSNLAKRLIARGYRLGCTVRDAGRLGRLEPLRGKFAMIPTEDMERAVLEFRPEIVVHTACTYARGGNTEDEVLTGNLLFPFQVMQFARRAGARRWINTSTMLPPMLNPYSLAKSQLVQWGEYYARNGDFQFVDLVLEHFYGPGAPENQFLSWVIGKLSRNEPLELTAGTQKRDFIFIEDVLNVYEAALLYPMEERSVEVGVGTGDAPTIQEVVEYLKQVLCSRSELHFGAVPMRAGEPDSCCDTAMMRKLGVDRPMDWRNGLKLTVCGKKSTGGGHSSARRRQLAVHRSHYSRLRTEAGIRFRQGSLCRERSAA